MSEVKHRELKIAVIDDNQEDNISFDVKCKDNTWHGTMNEHVLDGTHDGDDEIKITPDCTYAFNQVLELGGKEALAKYKHWIGGGELICDAGDCSFTAETANSDPFKEWLGKTENDYKYSIKKAMKTQVLWVAFPYTKMKDASVTFGATDCRYCWVDVDGDHPQLDDQYAKTERTREVEA